MSILNYNKSSLPAFRGQFGDFIGWMGTNSVKYIMEILKKANLTQHATGNKATSVKFKGLSISKSKSSVLWLKAAAEVCQL